MHIKSIFSIALFFSFFMMALLMPSAGYAQKDVPITIESGVIPPEFNLNNDTLIVASNGNPFYSMSMKKHFRKNYTGQFMMVDNIEKHAVENCRYVLYEGTGSAQAGGNTRLPGDPTSHQMTVHSSFYILDRKTKKEYSNPNLPSPKLIRGYINGLDKARQVPAK
jgi:hypothetical protein